MEVQSAFSAGVQGLQNAQQQASEAASNIATATSPRNDVEGVEALASNSNDVINVNQEIVELKVAEHQASASAQVIKSADETLGTLIDVTA